MKNFIECRQRTGETCRQYLTRLKLLANRTVTSTGTAASDTIINTKLEQDITTQFTLGLLMPIKQRVLSGNPKNLEEALIAAEREESIENLLHPSTSRDCRAVTNNFEKKGATYQPNRSNPRTRNIQIPITCFRCKKEGHTANNCTIVCYKCHKNGHYSNDCPRKYDRVPRQENQQRRCFKCQLLGHIAQFCPNAQARRPTNHLNYNTAAQEPRRQAANEANWE